MNQEFEKLGIHNSILKVIEQEKFEEPTEIQEKSIPLVLSGKDVIAGAATGSGKTLAFGSAIIQDVKKDFGIQALVLCPTRELSEQITRELRKFSGNTHLHITQVYGGVSINPQIEALEMADVVIGTPGRILDHISRGTIDFSRLKILVLDEADRMFDMGFRKDVEEIINECPEKRQTLLFSATISPDIANLASKYMKNPVEVSAEQYIDAEKLTQIYYDVEDNMKYSLLVHLLEHEKAKLVMVFCNTRKNVDFVANNLNSSGIEAMPIHGGFSQDKRNRIMEKFHSQKTHVLVCTDVAARGLDIKGVTHVYNYNIPADSKEYIHRVGRTARAGKEGKAINLVSSRDYENFRQVLMDDSLKIILQPVPEMKMQRISWIPNRTSRRDFRSNDRRDGFSAQNRSFGRRDFGRGRDRRESNRRSFTNQRGFRNSSSSRNPTRDSRRSFSHQRAFRRKNTAHLR